MTTDDCVDRTGQVWRFLTREHSFVAIVVDRPSLSPHANSDGYFVMHPIVLLDDSDVPSRYIVNKDRLGRRCLEENKLAPWEQQSSRKSRIV